MKRTRERAARARRLGGLGRLAVAVVAAVAIGALVTGGFVGPVRAQERVADFYVVRGRRVELTLELDRAGIVLTARDEEKSFFERLLAEGITRVLTHRRLLHVIDPLGAPDRDELTRLAFDLLEQKGVLRAGLLAMHEGAAEPLLITQEVVVRFRDDAREEDIQGALRRLGLTVLERSPYATNLLLVATSRGTDLDAIEVSRILNESPSVDYAEPNALQHVERLGDPPDDPYFGLQWHLDNDGRDGGAVDADIDAPQAWELTPGDPGVVIAVLEDGFDTAHPDIAPNLWSDATGAHGKSFADDASLAGDPDDRGAAAHGTAVAGCAAARAGNGIGVAGSCPECSLMLVRRSLDPWGDAEAIYWAAASGADILSNSWTYASSSVAPEVVRDAIADVAAAGRDGKGCVVLFGVRNVETETDLDADLATHPDVIAVGSITNTDERVMRCGYGACLSVLGPSRYNRSSSTAVGTLNVATTDWRSPGNGYNADPALAVEMTEGFAPCAELAGAADYTLCFGGTSAATPIVAGVAGLVLSADPELTARQVRHLLQDTADRAHDSAATYAEVNGYSTTLLHGNGRVNAFEAVRVVAPTEKGGRGGVDVFVRDNRLDWGNTEQPSSTLFEPVRGFISPFESVDIKVDAPPHAGAITDAAAFEAFADENPLGGANRVLVRVRNRGPEAAANVKVALFVADAEASALPLLPDGFWTALDASGPGSGPTAAGAGPVVGGWTLAGVVEIESLATCGPSLAGTAADLARVATFAIDVPELAGPPRELALLALVDCAQDPIAEASRAAQDVRAVVPTDNNATLRTVTLRATQVPR